jgi:adenylate kinase
MTAFYAFQGRDGYDLQDASGFSAMACHGTRVGRATSNGLTTYTQGTTFDSMETHSNPQGFTTATPQGRPGDRIPWLKGGQALCETVPVPQKEVRRLVLLGAPGVGKGTQADLLRQWCGACHLSTGDIFRAAKGLPPRDRTPAIESALGYMTRGELVPDDTVLALVCERMPCLHCTGGFLLDGFPRTVAQAEALEQLLQAEVLPLTAVINYELPMDEIVERLAGRRVCSSCQSVFHVTGLQPSPEICSHCGGRLYQREDDRPEAIRVRMASYHRSTEPLIAYYRQRYLLLTVSAQGAPVEIFQRTVDALASLPAVADDNASPAH